MHHRTTAKPYKQNESYKFQKSLGYEPRLLTTASGWDKTKRYSNNPSWENVADEAVFRISPGKLNFGPILAEHTYRLKVKLMNKSNFTARARLKAFKPKHLCSDEECIYVISKEAVTLAPGCSQFVTIGIYGQTIGKFTNVLEIITERSLYKIPITCEVMEATEHEERVEWNKLNEKLKKSKVTMQRSNRNDEVELIAHDDEGVGVLYEGDSFANGISNAYLNAKWDGFSKRLTIDNRDKWVVTANPSLNRKELEQKYAKTFKSAKSKWTSFKDKFNAGKSAKTMFSKVKQTQVGVDHDGGPDAAIKEEVDGEGIVENVDGDGEKKNIDVNEKIIIEAEDNNDEAII